MNQRTTGMGGHQSAAMLKDNWLTPPHVLRAVGAPAWYGTDPCAPLNRPWDTAQNHLTVADDGLSRPWSGHVWLNPPYGGPEIIGPWMRRMVQHGDGVALIFARTETELFFETVWRAAHAVFFLEGRLFFHVAEDSWFPRKGKPPIFVPRGGRAPANGGAPSVLVAYGEWAASLLAAVQLPGQFVRLQ